MKTSVFFLICLLLSVMAFGQKVTTNADVDIDEVEVSPPKFTGVINATAYFTDSGVNPITNYLAKNFQCPEEVTKCSLEGTEVVQFTVTESGNLTDFNILNSVCREIDKEAIRTLATTNGMWIPAYVNGKPTSMEQEVSLFIGDYDPDKIVHHFIVQAEKFYQMGSKRLLAEQKPNKALKYYNKGVQYMPNDKALLLLRGVCNYELGNKELARKDWNRIVTLGGINFEKGYDELAEMQGYSEMINILAKNKDK